MLRVRLTGRQRPLCERYFFSDAGGTWRGAPVRWLGAGYEIPDTGARQGFLSEIPFPRKGSLAAPDGESVKSSGKE